MADEQESFDPFPRPGDAHFESFPKIPSEDAIHFSIFYLPRDAPSPPQARYALSNVLQTARGLEKQFLKSYIWQRDAFAIALQQYAPKNPATQQRVSQTDLSDAQADWREQVLPHWYLRGSIVFGDSLADESAVLFLLRELSRTHKDLWVHATDSDGEFLLVEAAHVLPDWLNPDTGANRAWLHDGSVHLLPSSLSADNSKGIKDSDKTITEPQAIMYLSQSSVHTISSPSLTSSALFRIRDYPASLLSSQHTTVLTVSRRLAYLLHMQSHLIVPMSEAWYARDALSLTLLKRRTEGTLLFPVEDLVTCPVKFTRVSFAQTLAAASPPYLSTWVEASEDEKERKRRDVSAKVIAGAEILLADDGRKDSQAVREISLLLSDIEDGEDQLPSDDEIASWDGREESDNWLDVDYAQLERELRGQPADPKEKVPTKSGFGDEGAQENLRRIVEGFEKFLSDEQAGVDGAEFGGEASGDEEEADVNDSDTEEIPRTQEIAQALREMSGKSIPELAGHNADAFWAGTGLEDITGTIHDTANDEELPALEEIGSVDKAQDDAFIKQLGADALRSVGGLGRLAGQRRGGPLDDAEMDDDSDDEDQGAEDSDDEITLQDVQKVMQQIEQELKNAGAFSKVRTASNGKAQGKISSVRGQGKGQGDADDDDDDEYDDDDDVDDLDEDGARETLAKNILQAFNEGQGAPGPMSGMMGAMGLGMPRDDDNVIRKK